MKIWPWGIGRGAEIVVGLTFLVAAVLKALDFNGFLPQIYAYNIVQSNESLLVVAFIALASETALGLCLLLGVPWRHVVLGASAVLLLGFTGVIVYAWQVHGLEDCGCFGNVKVTPPQAIGKNLLLLLLVALAWYCLVRATETSAPTKHAGLRVGASLLLAFLLSLGVIPQIVSEASPPDGTAAGGGEVAAPPAAPPKEAGPFAKFVITSEYGETYDLSSGEYLVALLSMTCDHCRESVPQLNEFVFDSTLPPLVAICLEPEEGSTEEFRALTQPQFPMHSVGNKTLEFFPLLESASMPPRLVYVRDGKSVLSWDGEMPDYDTLHAGLAENGYAQTAESN